MNKLLLSLIIILTAGIYSGLNAKDLDKFYVRAIISSDHRLLDSVEINIMKDDTVKIPFKVLSTIKGCAPDVTKGDMRVLVESGLGNYTLYTTKDGYTPCIREFKISALSEDIKYLDVITMTKEMHRELGEVTVTSTRLKMVMKGDTIVYDAAAFNLPEGSMLDALIRQLPGASIDENGVITVNGRKMSELLINGKDFFKGDPKVALQNLPSYAVKNVQVYDKASEDNYLTNNKARFSRNENEEDMVIDVTLKKEFNAGWMGNAEGGYGTRDRYRGRLFAMGYTDKLRISVFGNANNVNDTETATSDGRWHTSGSSSGQTNRQNGGVNYTYDDSKRIRSTGNLTVNHQSKSLLEIMSTTGLYPTGNTYSRSINNKNDRVSELSTRHSFRYSGDNAYISINPALKWNVSNYNQNIRQANFTASPQESYRGEAVETLFAKRFEGIYSTNLLTALQTLRNHHNTGLNASVDANSTIRPKTWRGSLYVSATGSYSSSPSRDATLYLQGIGPMGDQSATPQNTNRYSPVTNKQSQVSGSVGYEHQWRKITDLRATSYRLRVGASMDHSTGRDTTDYYMQNLTGDMSVLPSMTLNQLMDPVPENIYRNRRLSNKFMQHFYLRFTSEPSAPGDSTFNAAYLASINATITEQNDRMRYEKPTILNERVRRPTTLGSGGVMFNLHSSNKVRSMDIEVYHRITMATPSLMYLVNTVDDSDPFNITYGNPDGLQNAITHRTTVAFSRFSRGKHPLNIYWDFHYNKTINAIAMARSYNPATGVSTSYPDNVKGNWNIDSYLQVTPTFGSRNQWQLYAMVYGEYHHDVDYLGLDVEPTPSVIRTAHIHNVLRLTYQIKGLGSVSFNTTNGVTRMKYPGQGSQSPRNHQFGLSTTLNLPYGFDFNTYFDAKINRGNTNSVMNVDQWIWNASVGKSFLKGKLGMRLSAYDILKSARPISTSVTAQSIVERWVNTLPRYVMLSLSYRFDIKPSKGNHNGPSRW